MARVSIVTSTYNRSNLIGKAIESVLNQTIKMWEYFIVDDGSTDKTRKIVKKYADKDRRIHYINKGKQPYYTYVRNIGIEQATAPYLCFLDDDNWWEPTFLEEHLKVHRIKDIAVTYSGRVVHYVDNGVREYISLIKYTGITDPLNGVVDVGDLMFKTALVKEVGGFTKDKDLVGYCSDLRLIDSVLEANPQMRIVLIPKYLHNYRAHGGSMTQRKLADRTKGIYNEEEQWKL